MAHFADGKWNAVTGLVASASGAPALVGTFGTVNGVANVEIQSATGVEQGTPATFSNSATPATLVTFNVPRAGFYEILIYLRVTVAGTGAGQVANVTVAYNDGSAQSAANIPTFRPGGTAVQSVDATTLNAAAQGASTVFCAAGSSITLAIVGSGTITTPATIQPYWAIEAI